MTYMLSLEHWEPWHSAQAQARMGGFGTASIHDGVMGQTHFARRMAVVQDMAHGAADPQPVFRLMTNIGLACAA